MYFSDRAQAGTMLASRFDGSSLEESIVIALSPGGVIVAEPIARALGAPLSMLMTSRISAPGDDALVIGTMDDSGVFTYNSMISAGEMEGYMSDMRTWFEEEKLRRLYQMATLAGGQSSLSRDDLSGRNVILATDGVKNGMSFDAALHYLQHINVRRVIGAIPVGPAETIERLNHVLDRLEVLYIPESFFGVSHYYTDEPSVDPGRVRDFLATSG